MEKTQVSNKLKHNKTPLADQSKVVQLSSCQKEKLWDVKTLQENSVQLDQASKTSYATTSHSKPFLKCIKQPRWSNLGVYGYLTYVSEMLAVMVWTQKGQKKIEDWLIWKHLKNWTTFSGLNQFLGLTVECTNLSPSIFMILAVMDPIKPLRSKCCHWNSWNLPIKHTRNHRCMEFLACFDPL